MAGSVNRAVLIGNVGKNPERHTFRDGNFVVNFSLATSESWRDRSSGERQEKTTWHNIQIKNQRIGEVAEKYVEKGSKVYVEGKIETRKWTTQDGQERYITEIVVGPFDGQLVLLSSAQTEPAERPAQQPQQRRQEVDDDEIPF
jgi:single-strand DNA-binding protein